MGQPMFEVVAEGTVVQVIKVLEKVPAGMRLGYANAAGGPVYIYQDHPVQRWVAIPEGTMGCWQLVGGARLFASVNECRDYLDGENARWNQARIEARRLAGLVILTTPDDAEDYGNGQ